MARRLIGLDIGTNAVTVAEVRPGDPPRLEMFGQVALGRETMREGEVADDAAVTEAVGRLRAEVGLKKVSVRLGLASPRVVVRQIEMPLMLRDELGSALQFQAAELIPIPLDDAVLDYAIRLVRATRTWAGVVAGAGPRGGISLIRAARAAALLAGRDFVTPDDVKRMALPALRHRIAPSPELELEGRDTDAILKGLLEKIEAPRK